MLARFVTAHPSVMRDTAIDAQIALGAIYYDLGRLDSARVVFERCAARDASTAACRGHLGLLALRRGDRAGAARIDAELAALDLPVPLKARASIFRARMAAVSGDRMAAVTLLRTAIAQGAGIGNPIDNGLAVILGYPEFGTLAGYASFEAMRRPTN